VAPCSATTGKIQSSGISRSSSRSGLWLVMRIWVVWLASRRLSRKTPAAAGCSAISGVVVQREIKKPGSGDHRAWAGRADPRPRLRHGSSDRPDRDGRCRRGRDRFLIGDGRGGQARLSSHPLRSGRCSRLRSRRLVRCGILQRGAPLDQGAGVGDRLRAAGPATGRSVCGGVRGPGQRPGDRRRARDRETFFRRLEAVLRPTLYREGTWFADYRRRRIVVRKTGELAS